MGRPTTASWMFVVAATAAFLGHESLLVAIGARGAAALRQDGRRAARSLTMFGIVAMAAGAAAWSIAPAAAGWTAGIPVTLAAAVGALIALARERSAVGELVAGAALTSVSLPVAYASAVPVAYVWSAWMAWLLVTSAGTLAVRTIIGVKKGVSTVRVRVTTVAVVALGEALLVARWPSAALAAAPSVALCLALTVLPPPPRFLRRVGWSLAAATMIAAAMLTFSVRRASRTSSSSAAISIFTEVSVLTSTGDRQ